MRGIVLNRAVQAIAAAAAGGCGCCGRRCGSDDIAALVMAASAFVTAGQAGGVLRIGSLAEGWGLAATITRVGVGVALEVVAGDGVFVFRMEELGESEFGLLLLFCDGRGCHCDRDIRTSLSEYLNDAGCEVPLLLVTRMASATPTTTLPPPQHSHTLGFSDSEGHHHSNKPSLLSMYSH